MKRTIFIVGLLAVFAYMQLTIERPSTFPVSLEIPTTLKDHQVVKRAGYALQYSEQHEQAFWVAYELTREELEGNAERRDNFKVDPLIKTGSAAPADYKNSGYDRGHLAPAADMKYSQRYMDESFLMSNISPQRPEFNRGIWAHLEEYVRDQAQKSGSILVVTGPVLNKNIDYQTIGENNVAVPEYYYKMLLKSTGGEYKGIAYLLPNKKGDNIADYVVSINDVEEKTGLDFFPDLPDDIEEKIESQADFWAF